MPHLDVMMSGEDGLTILRSLDRATSPAVIILSMIGQEVDRIVGLEMGADEVLAWSSLPPIGMNSAFIGDFVVA